MNQIVFFTFFLIFLTAERENNPTTNPRATSELSGPAGDTVHSGGKQGECRS